MINIRLRRPRYADVAATLALVLAMSGTAYAVSDALAPNSVDTAAIQNLAVTNPKIAGEAVSNSKIEPGAVGSGKLATGAVTNGKLASGAVTSGKLATGAVTSGKLADGAVSHSKLAANSVTGVDVSDNSLTLSDIRGINETGPITFTLAANGCGKITFAVTGAVAGQAALLTWTGAVPTHVVFGPLKVVSSTQIISYACNLTGSTVSASNIGVRVVTFG